MDEIGIGKGSLYNTFGSKHALFERAPARHRDSQTRMAGGTSRSPQGVRVNTVSPGPTRTGIWEDMDGDYIVEGGGIKTARARPTVDVSPVQRPYEGPSTG